MVPSRKKTMDTKEVESRMFLLTIFPKICWGILCFLYLQFWPFLSPEAVHSGDGVNISLNYKLWILAGRFGLLVSRGRQVRRGLTILAGVPHLMIRRR